MNSEERKLYFKDYRLKHYEKLITYQQEYYNKHKDTLLEKIKCECGRYYDIKHKKRHQTSNFHKINSA